MARLPNTDNRGGVTSEDVAPWERQDGESVEAYAAFVAYRDAEKRRIDKKQGTHGKWSVEWSWGYRCLEWDRHQARVADEELIRYRVQMNARQRAAAVTAQAKIITWLQSIDATKMKPNEAARWFEISCRIEREAAGSYAQDLIGATTGSEAPEQSPEAGELGPISDEQAQKFIEAFAEYPDLGLADAG